MINTVENVIGAGWLNSGGGVTILEVVSVAPQTPQEFAYDTSWATVNAALPTQVTVLLDDDSNTDIDVTWAQGDYLPSEDGTQDMEYQIVGTLTNLPENVQNTLGVVALIDVTVLAFTDAGETPTQASWFAIGTGVEVAAGNTINAVAPANTQANDIAIVVAVHNPAGGGGGAAVPVPDGTSGYSLVPGYPQEVNSGATPIRTNLLYKRSVTGSDLDFSYAVPSGQGHMYAVIFVIRGCYTFGSPFDVIGTTLKSTTSTSMSISGVSANQNGNIVVYIAGRGSDAAANQYSSSANASLTSFQERHDNGTTVGDGSGVAIFTGTLATAGATGTTTATISISTIEVGTCLTFKGVNNYAAPSVQSSNVTLLGDRQAQSANPGSGAFELFIGNASGTINGSFLPQDGTTYDTGDVLGGGNVVIGRVAAGGVAVYDEPFSYGDTWAIRCFSYNIGGSGPLYNSTTATNNPITPTISTPTTWVLNQVPIVQSVRNIEHPEAIGVTKPITKTFPTGFAETSEEYLLFVAGDNNGCRGSAIPEHLDMTYLLRKQKDDMLPFNEGWEWAELDGDSLPVPILPGYVPSSGTTGTTYQIWGCGSIVVSDTQIIQYYVENIGAIAARYSIGRVVYNKSGDVWTPTFDSGYIIANTQTRSYFFVRAYYSSTLSKYVIIAPNVLTNKQEVWTSASSSSGFTLKNSDLFSKNLEVAEGQYVIWNEIGDPWEDGTWTYFYVSLNAQTPAYKGADASTPIYQNVYKSIALAKVLTSELDTSSASVIIESVNYTVDNLGALGCYPSSKPITHDSVDHLITGRFIWRIEDQLGTFHQVPVDGCILSESALVGSGQSNYNGNIFFDKFRWYRMHDPATGDVSGNTAVPLNVLTGDPLTIVGTSPTQFAMTRVNFNGSSYAVDAATPAHEDAGFDPENFAVMGLIQTGSNAVERNIYNVPGMIRLYLGTDHRLAVEVTGSNGNRRHIKVTGSGYGTGIWFGQTAFGVLCKRNGSDMDITLFVDYTHPIPDISVTLNEGAFTELAVPVDTDPRMYNGFTSTVSDVMVLWGSNATYEKMRSLI